MAIFLYERNVHGQHGDLVSKPYLQYKECEKYLKMCKFANSRFAANHEQDSNGSVDILQRKIGPKVAGPAQFLFK